MRETSLYIPRSDLELVVRYTCSVSSDYEVSDVEIDHATNYETGSPVTLAPAEYEEAVRLLTEQIEADLDLLGEIYREALADARDEDELARGGL